MWNERFKLSVILTLIGLLVTGIAIRLVYLQVYKHEDMNRHAKSQSIKSVAIYENRGPIFDRSGKHLAVNKKNASLYVYGSEIDDPYRIKLILNDYGLKMHDRNYNNLRKKKGFIWIKRNIDVEKAEAITRRYPYINFVLEENRFYPEGENLAKIVGFTGVDNQGLHGIEFSMDDVLRGKKKKLIYLRDSRNRPILLKDKEFISDSTSSVQLTIDKNMQKTASIILKKDMKRFGASKGFAAGMDVKTGEILFSTSFPSYIPENFQDFPKEYWRSMLTNYLFEPGSIFKAFTFGFLLENKLFAPGKEVDCENGKYVVYNHVFNDVHKYEKLSSEEVFLKSSNIGTIKLMESVSNKRFYEFLNKTGIGQPIEIEGIPSESGILRAPDKWSGLSRPSISIGQEVLVTPLHILSYYAAIANDGVLVRPSVIKAVKHGNKAHELYIEKKRILNKDTAKQLQYLLRKAVTEGTGQNALSDYLPIAAKTGTAQKYDIRRNAYSYRDYVASFVGFFPYTSPEIAMIVVYDSPKKSIYGGSTAAFTFKSIAEQIMINKGFNIKRLRAEIETKKSS